MASTDVATSPERSHKLALYRSQVELRQFENRAYDLFLENFVKGTSHLAVGQEAIAAGFAAAMAPTDWTFATYRGHDHTLARGVPMTAVFAELMGRTNGLMAGKGGSMHLTSVEHGVMGSYAIIGAHLPIACGAAWSALYRGTDQVAVCFFGDGTTNIGAFHEALNLAAVWKLPVVFVCENNLWMEYTRTSEVTAVPNPAADRASAYGLPSIIVDGNDADAVFAVATAAIKRARRRGTEPDRGPHLSPRRPQPRRPGQVPARRRGRGLEAEGPDHHLSPATLGRRGQRSRARHDRDRGRRHGRSRDRRGQSGRYPRR